MIEIILNPFTYLAALANIIIGMLWYGPFFGKVWQKLTKVTPNKKDMPKSFTGMVIISLLMAVFLGRILSFTTFNPILITVCMWFVFTALVMFGDILWVKKSFKLFAVDAGFRLVSFVVMAWIIATFVI